MATKRNAGSGIVEAIAAASRKRCGANGTNQGGPVGSSDLLDRRTDAFWTVGTADHEPLTRRLEGGRPGQRSRGWVITRELPLGATTSTCVEGRGRLEQWTADSLA